MANKPRYVVTLYGRNHCVPGIYGPFHDLRAADLFGLTSGAARYRVSLLQNPLKFIFDEPRHPSERGKRNK